MNRVEGIDQFQLLEEKIDDFEAIETIKVKRFMNSKAFVKMMEKFIERYKVEIKNGDIEKWEDEEFTMWHIIKDAYDEGFAQADNYWIDTMFELTDAEEYFRRKIIDEIN